MTPKIKNIIIFASVAIILILVYIFFIKSSPEEDNLVSTDNSAKVVTTTNNSSADTLANKDFLAILLSVKSIKLDDSIFSDAAFTTLHDSNVVLSPDGNEGRPNPFAPIGADSSQPSSNIPVNTAPKPSTPTPTQTPAPTPSAPQPSSLPPTPTTIPTN